MLRTSLRVRLATGFACLAALSVVAACGSDEKSASSDDASSTSSASDTTADTGDDGPYEIDDCAGPDPDRGADAYQQVDCDDDTATVRVIALQPADFAGINEPDCPSGTDEIITVETTYGGAASGIPSQTLCVRYLTGDHPGDAGMGGGQLKEQDCISTDGSIIEIPCADAPPGSARVVAFANSVDECPAETTDPIELQFQVGRDYSVFCTVTL